MTGPAEYRIWIPGHARPAGSKTVHHSSKTGRSWVRDASKHSYAWKAWVKERAAEEVRFQENDSLPLVGPLSVSFSFFISRPKSHYGTGRNRGILKKSAPKYPTTRPDLTKLIRAAEDALTGILWHDDAQIVLQKASKFYEREDGEGLRVIVEEIA